MHLSLSAKLGKLPIAFSAPVRDYFSRLDAAGLRVGKYDLANARLIDRLVANGGNFWPDSGAFNAMAGYLYPVEDPSIPPLYNQRMYFDGADDNVQLGSSVLFSNNDFSVEADVVSPDGSSGMVLGGTGANDNRWSMLLNSSGVSTRDIVTGVVYIITFDTALTNGQLYTIKVERVGNTLMAYVGGVLQTSTATVLAGDTFGFSEIGSRINGSVNFFKGSIFNVKADIGNTGTNDHEWDGYGNTNADWEDQIGTNDGTVNGSPALFTGQGIPGSTLIPLHPNHDAGTLNAFVTGDWDAGTGLKGDGSTKYVDSNRAADVEGQNDIAIGVLPTVALTTGRSLIGVDTTRIDFDVGSSFFRTTNRSGSTTIGANTAGYSKYSANSRALSTKYNRYFNGALETVTASSSTPVSSNFYVFAENDGGPTYHMDGRNAFYHIGPNLSGTGELAELDAALTEWKNALASA